MSNPTWKIEYTDASGKGAVATITADTWSDDGQWVWCGGHAFAKGRVRAVLRVGDVDASPGSISTELIEGDPCAPENRAETERRVRAALADAAKREDAAIARRKEEERIAVQQKEARRQAKRQKKERKKRKKQASTSTRPVRDLLPPISAPRGGIRFVPPPDFNEASDWGSYPIGTPEWLDPRGDDE